MLHRLFFSINIPDDIRQELARYQKRWRRYPVRWTKPENLHFTVLFVGNVSDDALGAVERAGAAAVAGEHSFTIHLTKVMLVPSHRPATMVWAVGESEESPRRIAECLTRQLAATNVGHRESKPFSLHLTLGRAKGPHLKGVPINAELNLEFAATALDLMESVLGPNGPTYTTLHSFSLVNP